MNRAELLSIGAELLLGETIDTNAAFLGGELATIGLPLSEVRMLPDDRAVIAAAFAEARARSTLVLGTGGLGPTHDDLSREGVADALGQELREDPGLIAVLEERFRAFGPMPAANRRQAMLIPSAEAVPNPIGSAPGWWIDLDGVVTVLMPGVPSEMRRMWTESVRPRLAARFGLPPLAIRTIKSFGIGESALAERLGTLLSEPPAGSTQASTRATMAFTSASAPAAMRRRWMAASRSRARPSARTCTESTATTSRPSRSRASARSG